MDNKCFEPMEKIETIDDLLEGARIEKTGEGYCCGLCGNILDGIGEGMTAYMTFQAYLEGGILESELIDAQYDESECSTMVCLNCSHDIAQFDRELVSHILTTNQGNQE